MATGPDLAAAPPSAAEFERVFRQEYGRTVSVLVRVFGDIDIAEDAVQDAFAIALERWPREGLPPSPAGWLITTARNKGIDRMRREASRQDRHTQAAWLAGALSSAANLTGAQLTGAQLSGAQLSGAQLETPESDPGGRTRAR